MIMVRKSFIDDLTGLYNRRYLRHWIAAELAKCKRYKVPLSIALIDLDDFKQINDTKGHLVGDRILMQFSEFLKERLRDSDLVIRYGGDEFILTLPNTDKKHSYAVMKRVLKNVKTSKFIDIPLSASCGISSYPEDGSEWETLFTAADRRMYQAKRADKGGIEIEEVIESQLLLPTPTLVGRKDEMKLCQTLLKQKDTGLIVLKGEAGVGKTRLVNEVIKKLPDKILFTGASYTTMSQSPYFAIREVLQSLLTKQRNIVRDIFVTKLSLPQRKVIMSFLPELTHSSSDISGDRLMLFDSITRFIDLLSDKIPLAILFDDLHWASESTSELIHFLLKSRKRLYPIFGTYRIEEIKGTLIHKKFRLMGREKLYREISLRPLDKGSSKEMIYTILTLEPSPGLLNFIYKESGGNPFFIEEILKEMKESGALYRTNKGYDFDSDIDFHIPRTIEDTINYKLSLLDDNLLNVLNISALIGKGFNPSLLHSTTGINEGELYDILDQLMELQFIIEEEENLYNFKEDVFRQIVVDNIPKGTKKELHGKIADTIERIVTDSPEKTEQLAHHYYRSGNKVKTVDYAERAGDHAKSIYAHKEAIRFYNWALTGKMENDHRARIWGKIGSEARIKGDYSFAIESLKKALNLIPEDGERAVIFKELGITYSDIGNHKMALSNLRKARKNYTEKQEKYGCDPDIAWAYMEIGKEKSALRSAQRVIDKIDKERFKKEYSLALNTKASIYKRQGKKKKAIEIYEKSRKIREEIGYKEGVGSIYNNMAGVYLNLNEPDKAKIYYEKALKLYRDTGFKEGEIITLGNLSSLEIRMNDMDRAEKFLRKTLEMTEWVGGIKSQARLLRLLALVLMIKGSMKDALNLYKQAEEKAEQTESPEALLAIYARFIITYSRFLKDPEKARKYIVKAEKYLTKIDSESTAISFYIAKARYHLETEETEEGIKVLKEKLFPLMNEKSDNYNLYCLYSLQSLFYSKKGWDKWGERYLELSMKYARKTKDPSSIADVHLMAGRFYLNLKNLKKAKRRFNESLKIYKELSFYWFIKDTERYLEKVKDGC